MGYIFKVMQMTFVFLWWENFQTVLGLMQWALLTIEKWCNKVGLLVNPDNTELIVFTRRRKLSFFYEPHIFYVTL